MNKKIHIAAVLVLTMLSGQELLYSGPIRLERFKATIQSSILHNDPAFAPSMANDDRAYDNSVAQTELENNPWWEIDLQGEYPIENVTVLAPVSFGAGWLRTFQVLLSNDGQNYKLIYTHDGSNFRNRAVPAGGLTARYVRIRLQERQVLALQEVWIFQDGSIAQGPRPVHWTPVQIPGALHPGSSVEGATKDPTKAGCQSLVGTWSWFNGRTVTMTAGGSLSDGGGSGTWSRTGPQTYQLNWKTYNTIDTVTLSNDGLTLTGVFNGNKGNCRRLSGDCMPGSSTATPSSASTNTSSSVPTPGVSTCQSLAGTWSWFNGRTVTMTASGSLSDGGGSGTWSRTGPQTYQLNWKTYNTIDTVTLSNDGLTLTGVFNGNKGNCRRLSGDCMPGSSAATPSSASTNTSSSVPTPGVSTCQSLAGTWSWFNGRTVTMTAGGSLSDGGGSGTWSRTGPQTYQLNWKTYNTIDTVTLSNDGLTLTGVFNGNKGNCRRLSGDCMPGSSAATPSSASTNTSSSVPTPGVSTCQSLAGTWSWFNGRTVTMTASGSLSDGGGSGTWSRTGPQTYRLNWKTYNTIDTVTLSNDGLTLTGVFNGNKGNCRRLSGDCMPQ
jgi:hypothetical protein